MKELLLVLLLVGAMGTFDTKARDCRAGTATVYVKGRTREWGIKGTSGDIPLGSQFVMETVVVPNNQPQPIANAMLGHTGAHCIMPNVCNGTVFVSN